MIIDLPPQQPVVEWHQIVDTCLKDENLRADVRVSTDSVNVNVPEGFLSLAASCAASLFGEGTPKRHYVSKTTTLDNVESSLKVYFATSVNQMANEAGITDTKSPFAKEANESLSSLVQEVENAKDPLDKPTSEIIQKVYCHALKDLFSLKAEYTQSRALLSSDARNSADITPLPNTLILSGGGMKGIGYIGAYRAMVDSGILQDLKLVAGSSVGASTATFIAVGMTPDMLQEMSDNTDYERLLTGHSPSFSDAINFDNGGLFDGTYAMSQVNRGIIDTLRTFFKCISLDDLQNEIDTLTANGTLTADQGTLILQLRNNILTPPSDNTDDTQPSDAGNDNGSQTSIMRTSTPLLVTFQDLEALHQLNPSQFKSLVVTAFDKTKNQEVYFSAQSNPIMSIAEAVRASMALPGIFQPVVSDTGDLLEDGGIGSNTPSEISDDPSRTLVCFFNPQGNNSPLSEWCQETLSGNPNLTEDQKEDAEKIKEAGPNAIDIYYGSLTTTTFTASLSDIHAAELQAETKAWEQLCDRQN